MKKRFKDRLIIVFGRYPEPGKTKTRLIPELGAIRAADLQRRLTERIIQVLKKVCRKNDAGIVFFGEGGTVPDFKKWLGADMDVMLQADGDIGGKMAAAFTQAFRAGAKQAILVGTDIPRVSERHFQEAFHGLSSNDMVLGPSLDGGYWLIGMNRYHEVFGEIPWGTNTVFFRTKERIGRIGLSLHELETLADIDTLDDVKTHMPKEDVRKAYVSVIIPALNEEDHIQAAVLSALDECARVIVADGGSRDRTRDIAGNAGAFVIETQKGRAVQQNAGAALSRGETLVFLHADTRLPQGYSRHVFKTLLEPETVLGAFGFKTDLDSPMMRFFERAANVRAAWLNLPYGDQGLFLRRETFVHAGGFPEVPIAEDLMLVRRLSGSGRLKIVPAHAVTSGRRWKNTGLLRTFVVNQLILSGCFLGISPEKLAPLYKMPGASGR